ncbi:hypothetical protein NliqN6_1807 [Naganishia liquefaciens]|uniref:Uncharacterized protein n=1 Tax=Naganishia liquefaciens TaxID=104408 RepID=A0A8H3YDG3_9TREE|nr:hypothetical protein NliqN6_1807 [Naganishia liquefaciens]
MDRYDPRPPEHVHLRDAQPPLPTVADRRQQRREFRETEEWAKRREDLMVDALDRFSPIVDETLERMEQRIQIVGEILSRAELAEISAPPGMIPPPARTDQLLAIVNSLRNGIPAPMRLRPRSSTNARSFALDGRLLAPDGRRTVRVKTTSFDDLEEVLDFLHDNNPKSDHKVVPMQSQLYELRGKFNEVTEIYIGATFRKASERAAEDMAAMSKAETAFSHRLARLAPGELFESFVLHELVVHDIPTQVPRFSDTPLTNS